MKKFFVVSSIILSSYAAQAQIYKTLPKGVRLLAYRNVTTSKIKANYNQAQAETPMAYGINLNTKLLAEAGDAYKEAIEYVRSINPNAYDQFTLGEFKISAEAQLNVHGFGMGYGVTDHFTLYGSLPYYKANVNMKYKQLKQSNNQQLADDFYDSANSDDQTLITDGLRAAPAVNGNIIQSAIVNTLDYEPIGTWQGQGYGDFEMGSIYRLIDKGTWGMALTNGFVAPTGRVDDPDILQDLGFGDGQWDLFSEAGIGASPIERWNVGFSTRYTYQAEGKRILRIPNDPDVSLSADKGDFKVKYGDKLDFTFSTGVTINDWFSIAGAYEINRQYSSHYTSEYGIANDYLAKNSERRSHVARLSATVSSIQPFLKKQFLLPASIVFNAQQTVAGRNVPKVTRYEIELRLLF